MDDSFFFYALAALTILFSIMAISLKQVSKASMALVAHLSLMAGIYANLGAEVIAAAQIFIYTTAILALIVFVIKPLHLKYYKQKEQSKLGKLESLTIAFILVSIATFIFSGLIFDDLLSKHWLSTSSLEPLSASSLEHTLLFHYRTPIYLVIFLSVLTAISYRLIKKKNQVHVHKSNGGHSFDSP